jgi:hypothetical protein
LFDALYTVLSFSSHRLEGMNTRTKVAAIDHNSHIHRQPIKLASGVVRRTRKWNKKSSRWVAVDVKEKKSYNYLVPLQAVIIKARGDDVAHGGINRKTAAVPDTHPSKIAPTIAPVQPPPTAELAAKQISRFTKAK